MPKRHLSKVIDNSGRAPAPAPEAMAFFAVSPKRKTLSVEIDTLKKGSIPHIKTMILKNKISDDVLQKILDVLAIPCNDVQVSKDEGLVRISGTEDISFAMEKIRQLFLRIEGILNNEGLVDADNSQTNGERPKAKPFHWPVEWTRKHRRSA